jgi:hypothetical protein
MKAFLSISLIWYLTLWTTFAPLVLFLQILFGKSFQSLFANSQRYMNKIHKKHFQDLKFSPPVSNAFPLTQTKLPLNKIRLLVLKRVLPIERRLTIPIWKILTNWVLIFFKIGGGAVLLLWAKTFSPFGINRQKQSLLRALCYFLPNGTHEYEWILYQSGERCGVMAKGK